MIRRWFRPAILSAVLGGLLCAALHGGRAAAAQGKLRIYYSSSQAASQRMIAEMKAAPEFRTAMLSRWDVQFFDVSPQADLPVFLACLSGRCYRKSGYQGLAELASWLGINWQPKAENGNGKAESRDPRVADLLKRVTALEGRVDRNDKDLDVLAANQQKLKTFVEKLPFEKWDKAADALERVQPKTKSTAPKAESGRPGAIARSAGERLSRAAGAAGAIARLAGRLGFTSAVAATGWGGIALTALGIAGWMARRIRKRKTESGKRETETIIEKPIPVAVDSPPPPQQTVTETNFVPYEKDTYAKAVAWAQEQIGRKYPGAVGTLTTLNSLVEQFLTAQKDNSHA